MIKSNKNFNKIELSVVITKEDSSPVITFGAITYCELNSTNNITLNLGKLPLTSGNYSFNIGFSDPKSKIILKRYQSVLPFTMQSTSADWASIVLPIKNIIV